MSESKPKFFKTPGDFRIWLERNHHRLEEQWVGFYKRDSGKPSITWPESVDQALCFGWIDGLRKSIDTDSYKIRFTPRRPRCNWSKVNLARIEVLTKDGLMRPAGLRAYAEHDPERTNLASYENPLALLPAYVVEFKEKASAWKYYSSCPPWYQRATAHWVMSAKREETRRRRFDTLVADSAASRYIKAAAKPERKK